MEIKKITDNKKQYVDLLLLADEQEDMIDRYLSRGDMFVLSEGDTVIAECVITRESDGVYELKNLAVAPAYQRNGYGKALINSLLSISRTAGRFMSARATFHRRSDSTINVDFTIRTE